VLFRSDDQDDAAIDKRHDIYYNTVDGTLASAYYFKDMAAKSGGKTKYITLDGAADMKSVTDELISKL
jgi:adenylate kinase